MHSISILKNLIRICLLCLFYSYFHRLDTSFTACWISLYGLWHYMSMPLSYFYLFPQQYHRHIIPISIFHSLVFILCQQPPQVNYFSSGCGCLILRLLIGRPLFLVNSLILFCLYLLHFLYLNSRDFLVSRLLQMLMLLRADGSFWIKIFCSLNLACMLLRSTN